MSLVRQNNEEQEIRKSRKSRLMQNSFVIALICALLLVAIVFLIYRFFNEANKTKINQPVYQYMMTEKQVYENGCTLLQTDDGLKIKGADSTDFVDPTPLYDEDGKGLYLMEDSLWIEADATCWKLPALSHIYQEEDQTIHIETPEGKKYFMDGGFIVTGLSLYIFPEHTDLIVNNELYQVGPLSFYQSEAGMERIYNASEDDLELITDDLVNAKAICARGIEIDLKSADMVTSSGSTILIVAGSDMGNDLSNRAEE